MSFFERQSRFGSAKSHQTPNQPRACSPGATNKQSQAVTLNNWQTSPSPEHRRRALQEVASSRWSRGRSRGGAAGGRGGIRVGASRWWGAMRKGVGLQGLVFYQMNCILTDRPSIVIKPPQSPAQTDKKIDNLVIYHLICKLFHIQRVFKKRK